LIVFGAQRARCLSFASRAVIVAEEMRQVGYLFVPGQLFKNMSQADNIVDVGGQNDWWRS
jgi:hypothetical protein